MIKLLKIIEERIGSEDLIDHDIKNKYFPCFKNLETNEIYLTGTFHDFERLPAQIAIKFFNDTIKDVELRTVIDGFYDKENKKFYTKDQLEKLLDIHADESRADRLGQVSPSEKAHKIFDKQNSKKKMPAKIIIDK